MSAEAWRLVMDHSTARGAGLLALLALADESKDRGNYPRASLAIPDWAIKCRCKDRSMTDTVQKLIRKRQLSIVHPATGNLPPVYEIPVRKTGGLGVRKTAPVIREDPLEHASRAEFTVENEVRDHESVVPSQPSNIIRYEPAKNPRKKA